MAAHDDEQPRKSFCMPSKDREGLCPPLIALCLLENGLMDFGSFAVLASMYRTSSRASTSGSGRFAKQNVRVWPKLLLTAGSLSSKPRALGKLGIEKNGGPSPLGSLVD